MMSEKLCMFCKHLEFNDGGAGDYADPAALTCAKSRFKSYWNDEQTTGERFVFDIEDFRALIVTAATCPDYDEVSK